MANLYIIRGVPGSGKTTLAEKMFRHGMVDLVAEADIFMVDRNGDYSFNANMLKFCHEQCQNITDAALQINHNVAVSNTFTRKWEMKPYFDMAKKHGAQVTVIVCQGDFTNVHGVPNGKVQAMRDRFEY